MTFFLFHPYTRGLFGCFSTAGLARMTPARLSFNNLNCVVTKDEVELFVKKHGDPEY